MHPTGPSGSPPGRRCGCIGNFWGCPRGSLHLGELGAEPSRPRGATHLGFHRQAVGIAAMVATSGVLMLNGAGQSRIRWFDHAPGRRACWTLARPAPVGGTVVHITRAELGTPRERDRPSPGRARAGVRLASRGSRTAGARGPPEVDPCRRQNETPPLAVTPGAAPCSGQAAAALPLVKVSSALRCLLM